MRKPEETLVRVVEESGKFIDNVILVLTLYSALKNHYSIVSEKSQQGIILFSRIFIEREISWYKQSNIMDYSSNYDDCLDVFKLELMSDENILRLIKEWKNNKYFYNVSDEDINALVNSENYKYYQAKNEYSFLKENMEIKFIAKQKEAIEIHDIEIKRSKAIEQMLYEKRKKKKTE